MYAREVGRERVATRMVALNPLNVRVRVGVGVEMALASLSQSVRVQCSRGVVNTGAGVVSNCCWQRQVATARKAGAQQSLTERRGVFIVRRRGAFGVEGCNLVGNSTRPDQTVSNFNPTRQEPDYFEPDPNPTHLNPTRHLLRKPEKLAYSNLAKK